jgi:hypothetical protein
MTRFGHRQDSDYFYLIPANIARIRDKCWNPDSFVGIWDSRIPAKVAGSGQIRPANRPESGSLARSGQMAGIRSDGRNPVRWIWPNPSGQPAGIWSDGRNPAGLIGHRNFGWPDSGEGGRIPSPDSSDINRMLSDSDIGNISMVVGCLNVKVDCAV